MKGSKQSDTQLLPKFLTAMVLICTNTSDSIEHNMNLLHLDGPMKYSRCLPTARLTAARLTPIDEDNASLQEISSRYNYIWNRRRAKARRYEQMGASRTTNENPGL